jgi:hypothetical protein
MLVKTKCPHCKGIGWTISNDADEVEKKDLCQNCGSISTYKRRLGIWTLTAGIFTLGLSLLFIPLYRKRCQYCNAPIDNNQKRV